ncbi:thioredoxin family protein [Chloroflexus sp.]|uniref:thioredoxin family protein n=1 Tax=Chloroflexus sp. TaxID=1904827 RepID=UPI00262DF388|nr:thioredoxin family protein [uncultured Chloroflexus sp.]
MIERLLVVAVIGGVILLVWAGLRRWQAGRLRALSETQLFIGIVPPGKPVVVAFSTPGCRECRSRQAPALTQLVALLGEQVTVATVLAPEHPHLVDRLGILTAPATVVLDGRGIVRQVNQGFADAITLARQVQMLSAG